MIDPPSGLATNFISVETLAMSVKASLSIKLKLYVQFSGSSASILCFAYLYLLAAKYRQDLLLLYGHMPRNTTHPPKKKKKLL